MSKMMQPRDQMSDLMEKENLRVSGAIQDFWQGSVGRIKVEDPLSATFPGEKEQSQPGPQHYHSSFGCFERGIPVSQMCLQLPIFLPPPPSAETTVLARQDSATLSPFQWSFARTPDRSPFSHPLWVG